jgi:carbonic anhydrase
MKTIKILMLVMLAASFTSLNAQKKVDPVGTWTYSADDAPYEYSSGDIIVSKEGKAYAVEIKLGEYYKMNATGVNYEKNVLSFKLYIEGETISVKATMGKEEFEGEASYSEGTIPVTGKKKK